MTITSIGRVISTSMRKTAKVEVTRLILHPRVKKFYKRKKKVFAHDPENTCAIGDLVRIAESPRISKIKHFEVIEILEQASRNDPHAGGIITQYD